MIGKKQENRMESLEKVLEERRMEQEIMKEEIVGVNQKLAGVETDVSDINRKLEQVLLLLADLKSRPSEIGRIPDRIPKGECSTVGIRKGKEVEVIAEGEGKTDINRGEDEVGRVGYGPIRVGSGPNLARNGPNEELEAQLTQNRWENRRDGRIGERQGLQCRNGVGYRPVRVGYGPDLGRSGPSDEIEANMTQNWWENRREGEIGEQRGYPFRNGRDREIFSTRERDDGRWNCGDEWPPPDWRRDCKPRKIEISTFTSEDPNT